MRRRRPGGSARRGAASASQTQPVARVSGRYSEAKVSSTINRLPNRSLSTRTRPRADREAGLMPAPSRVRMPVYCPR